MLEEMKSQPPAPGRHVLVLTIAVALSALPTLAEDRPFLWEVNADGAHAYLLGSMHFATKDIYPLDPAIEEAFSASETLVVEVDIDSADPLVLQQKMMAAGVFKDDRKLSDEIAPETLEKLQAFVAKRGVPFQMLDSMKPWLGSLMISILELQRLGFDPDLGIDKHFLGKARERGIPVEALESADFQIELLSSFADGLEDDLIKYTLDYLDEIPETISQLVDVWKAGDAEALEKLVLDTEGLEKFPAVYDKMFFERNVAMSDKIAKLLESDGNWFVVVGSGHLVGDRGVVSLLNQDDRFEVRQVEAAVAVQ
jgi:uncharacterized protein